MSSNAKDEIFDVFRESKGTKFDTSGEINDSASKWIKEGLEFACSSMNLVKFHIEKEQTYLMNNGISSEPFKIQSLTVTANDYDTLNQFQISTPHKFKNIRFWKTSFDKRIKDSKTSLWTSVELLSRRKLDPEFLYIIFSLNLDRINQLIESVNKKIRSSETLTESEKILFDLDTDTFEAYDLNVSDNTTNAKRLIKTIFQ